MKSKTVVEVEKTIETIDTPIEASIVEEVLPDPEPAPDALSIYTKFNGSIDDLPKPDNGPYWVAAKEGFYVHKKIAFGRALMPFKEMPTTLVAMEKGYKGGCFWHNFEDAPKLPAEIMAKTLAFFRGVYAKFQTEAEVLLFFDPATKLYRIYVPEQICSGASVKSCMNSWATRMPANYQLVGSIHSHPVFNAFHSGTDTADAKDFNGLHITVGHITDPAKTEYASMISVNGQNFDYDIKDVAEIDDMPEVEIPEWWYTMVEKPVYNVIQTVVKDVTGKGKKDKQHNQQGMPWYNSWKDRDADWNAYGGDYNKGPWKGYGDYEYNTYCSQVGLTIPRSWLGEGFRLKPESWPKAIEMLAKKLNGEAERDGFHIEMMIGEILGSSSPKKDESIGAIIEGDITEVDGTEDGALEMALTIHKNYLTNHPETMLNMPKDEVEDYIGE